MENSHLTVFDFFPDESDPVHSGTDHHHYGGRSPATIWSGLFYFPSTAHPQPWDLSPRLRPASRKPPRDFRRLSRQHRSTRGGSQGHRRRSWIALLSFTGEVESPRLTSRESSSPPHVSTPKTRCTVFFSNRSVPSVPTSEIVPTLSRLLSPTRRSRLPASGRWASLFARPASLRHGSLAP